VAIALFFPLPCDLIEPLLPTPRYKPKSGRPRRSDWVCLTGILFALRSGIPWRMLPQELGCGSGMTCWRRLRDWQEDGIWQLIHFVLLDWLARQSLGKSSLRVNVASTATVALFTIPTTPAWTFSHESASPGPRRFSTTRPYCALRMGSPRIWRAQATI